MDKTKLRIALYIALAAVVAMLAMMLIPVVSDILASLAEWYKDQMRTFSYHGFRDERGIGALARVLMIAVFIGWAASRFKDSNKNKK